MMNDQKHVDKLNAELKKRLDAIYRDEPKPLVHHINTPEGKAEFLRNHVDRILSNMLDHVRDFPAEWRGIELELYTELMVIKHTNHLTKRSLRLKSFRRAVEDKELLDG